jgi:pimeloyl-ACP methyl ester carboxylesterase
MVKTVKLTIDIDASAHFKGPTRLAVTLTLPEPEALGRTPVVCFAKPGGGYSRAYFTCELPGPGRGAQAAWHAGRGWVFVALDNLGTGESSRHEDDELSLPAIAQAAYLAEQEILLRLANGVAADGFPPVIQPVRLGIGHSLGGCLTIVQQAHFRCYDGIAVLGYSPYHNQPSAPPGEPPLVVPWLSRDVPPASPGGILNRDALERTSGPESEQSGWSAMAWSSYYSDVPQDVVDEDLRHYENIVVSNPDAGGSPLPWAASGSPGKAARTVLTPGIVAAEAAAIDVPVLSAMGERDFVVDPLGEPRAYRSATNVELFVCAKMGHIHNFASTRQLLWQKIDNFGQWCAIARGAR